MNNNQEQPLYKVKTNEFINLVRNRLKITKQKFTLDEAILKAKYNHLNDLVQDYKPFIDAYKHLSAQPLKDNQFYNYVCYYQETSNKFDEEYFNYDLEILHDEYRKVDEAKAKAKREGKDNFVKRYNTRTYEDYVTFILLKLSNKYNSNKEEYDKIFKVKQEAKEKRIYSPLTKVPTILRAELPKEYEVEEYDIARAFPTFIDIQLGIKEREIDVYSLINKKDFNRLLNTHKDTKGASIEDVRKELSVVYGDKVKDVITEERFNNKGAFFKEAEAFETEYINKFIEVNLKDIPHARLHDGLHILKSVDDSNFITQFGQVKFVKKIENRPIKLKNKNPFYSFDAKGKIYTDTFGYLEFLKNEKFAILDDEERNKTLYFKNENRLIKSYNKERFGELLNSKIIHLNNREIVNQIGKDIGGYTFKGALGQLPFVDNKYYRDSKNMTCLLFKNGLFAQSINDNNNIVVKKIDVDEVEGNFQEHHALSNHNFKYTEEVGVWERFIQLIAIRKDFEQNENGKWHNDNLTEQEKEMMLCWQSMIGYLLTTWKTQTDTAMVVLTDENPSPNERKGRRGKSLIQEALKEVVHAMDFNSVSWKADAKFSWNGLKPYQTIIALDDLPHNFDYDSLFSTLTNGVKGELKNGGMMQIPFLKTPKFIGSTNYALREGKDSYKARFAEFKVTDFFSSEYTPYDYFGQKFFGENWSEEENNKFYSWVFRCLHTYMVNGLVRPNYDKVEDTFMIYFSNEEKLYEFDRLFHAVIRNNKNRTFKIKDLDDLYNHKDNYAYSKEKWFTSRNWKYNLSAYCDKFGYTLSKKKNVYTLTNYDEVLQRIKDEEKAEIEKETEIRKAEYQSNEKDVNEIDVQSNEIQADDFHEEDEFYKAYNSNDALPF